ncbi:MAG: diguanylate cyclase [Chloroflexi bacterium]|nr:diguanylate cyclase [Chloroflexota bacterium]
MNIHALIPLIAAIAYIPLFIALVNNRPWHRQQRLFAAYLCAAVFWSLTDIFCRSDFFMAYKFLLVQVVIFAFLLTCVQSHYFVASFYRTVAFKFPVAYGIPALGIVLMALGYMPHSVIVNGGVTPVYGSWIYLLGFFLFTLAFMDVYFLVRKLRILADPEKRNQLVYLILGISLLSAFIGVSVTRFGREFPIAHVGNLTNAFVLSYVIVRHRLLDMRFVMRRGIVYSLMAGIFMAVYLLWLVLIHVVLHVDYSLASFLAVGLLTAVAAAAFWARARVYLYRRVDQIFYGERYGYREDLVEFLRRKAPVVSNLDEFGMELLVPITKAVGCSRAYLLFPEVGTNDIVVQFAQPAKEDDLSLRVRQDSPVVEWLKRENRYLSRENLDILPEFRGMWAEENDGLKALDMELLFPLLSRGNLVAVLALGRRESGKYSLEDVNLIETVTAQVATSLEKEYLQEELRKREQELALVNRLATVITSSLNIREVYDAFIVELREVVDIDWATIVLIEGDEMCFEVLSTGVGSDWEAGDKVPLKGTGTEWVAKRKKALVEPDLAKNRRFWTGEHHLKQGIRSIVYLPLVVKGEVIGSLIIASRQPKAYTPGQVRLLERLASQIAVPVENSRLYAEAEQRARIDQLTDLFNRRHFDVCMKQEIDRHSRYRSMLSLILLDLDFFKAYNDAQGHVAGDKILELMGKLINRAVRNTDLAFRYGGDEFAIILPQSATNDALVVAERVRGRIAAEMSKKDIRISASLGLASWPSDGVTADEVINAADRALYYAKETGGNRTCVASKMLPSLTETANARVATEKEVLSIIYNLAATIETVDPYTYGHSRKVTGYAVALAEAVGLPSEKVAVISTAAMLHDIGKVGIPDEVLNKAGKLEVESWELIRSHSKLSATIVGHVVSLISCLPAILYHHERWDGAGYPDGLKGEAIPIEARILSVADAFDAMTSSRPYRGKLSYKKVLQELKRCSGTQFDPKLVEAFLPIALSTAPEEVVVGEGEGSSKADS